MSKHQEKTKSSKIFKKLEASVSLNSYKHLYQCSLLQLTKKENKPKKEWHFRIYDEFMLISSNSCFSKNKIAKYDFKISIKFRTKLDFSEEKQAIRFQIKQKSRKLNFLIFDFAVSLEIQEILKKKLNFSGFHETFQIMKLIGSGHFASVYLVQNVFSSNFFAAKALPMEELKAKKKGIPSIENEINILREINHPNLIKLDSVYETKNTYYLIFELFSGGNLKDYISQHGSFSENEACHILKNILEGLSYLHKNNIMHRDIKPESILFRTEKIFERNQIAIADFGLATHNDVTEYIYGRCGTPGYIAPEIYDHYKLTDHYDIKCDIYSVGITYFYMLTSDLPYKGELGLLEENKLMKFDYNRMARLSKKGFLYRLICPQEHRFDVFQTLLHDYLREKLSNISLEDLEDDDPSLMERGGRVSLVSTNLLEFNMRKISMEETNLMRTMPGSSPVIINSKKFDFNCEGSQSFVMMSPVLNGYLKTVNNIPFASKTKKTKENETKYLGLGEENLKSAASERKKRIEINKPFCSNFNQYRLMRELEELDNH